MKPTDIQSLTNIVAQLALTVQQLAESQRQPVQITSTADTANAIPKFTGDPLDDAKQWTQDVERIAAQALWTPALTLLNATSRLSGLAANWQKTNGKHHHEWEEWKRVLIERFRRRLSMKDFIELQAKRTLRRNETLVQYIFEKDALLEKSPHPLTPEERISMIIGDIKDTKWSIPLASHLYSSVTELVDRAATLDSLRQLEKEGSNDKKDAGTREKPFLRKFNPKLGDKTEDLHCWRCGKKGHISHQCHLPPPEAGSALAAPADGETATPTHQRNAHQRRSNEAGTAHHNHASNTRLPRSSSENAANGSTQDAKKPNARYSVNCLYTEGPRAPIVNAIINGTTTVDALCDCGSEVTLIRKHVAPPELPVFKWQNGPIETAAGPITPAGWITLRVKVGNIDYTMPQVGLCEHLPVTLVLGNDWKWFVQARYIIEADGSFCITTPTSIQEFTRFKAQTLTANCIFKSRPMEASLQTDVALAPRATTETLCSTKSTEPLPQITTSGERMPVDHPSPSALNTETITDKVTIHASLAATEQEELCSLVKEYEDIFAHQAKIGECPYVELSINLEHSRPVRRQPYRLSQPDRQFLENQVQTWREQGICRPSTSMYASPAFVVDQPFHDTTPRRVVVDYSRTINPITVADLQPVDFMEDALHAIAGSRFMSNMDIKSAFFTIKVKEDDVHKTAFVTQDHHEEFLRMPFGLKNGPPTMTRAIKLAYSHLRKLGVVTYIDDIACAHNNFEDHIKCLREIFKATRSMGFTLSPTKCVFASPTITLLGRVLTTEGIQPDPDRTSAVSRYATLTSIHEVRSFLGFANTFRKHIENFAVIARPLNELLKKTTSKEKNKETPTQALQLALDNTQQESFESLKMKITSPPVLSFFKQECQTYVETDASHEGLGACLSQDQNGKRRVIEYASRSLKDAEKSEQSQAEPQVCTLHR
ncbi:uncharacterized protein LOC121046550 [Ixodes scapularis]|uniref:uncharacterized protein LOC121046550 n=1 Tax=Ixodes scapularis TaxID=6945 RepID=UPI001AD7B7E7|nr:uncharacterized protein LOC121046550 [Ixodes scapularis]